MTNFEYFIWLLQENEDLVEVINSLDTDEIPHLANEVVFGGVDEWVEETD